MAFPRLKHLIPQAGTDLQTLLEASRGALLPPLRAEIFGPQRLAAHGRSLGATHRAATPSWHAASFFPRLRSNIRVLREAHRFISAQARAGHEISPAAEWLLDNFHLIEAQFEAVHEGLPRNYYRALPVLLDEPLAGLPRVYGIAWAFVAHTDGAFDEEQLLHFLAAYQESCELTLGEIWALPTTLRVVLMENLRRLAERMATHKAAREAANLCCDRLDACHPVPLDELLAAMNRRGVGTVFLAQLALRLREHGEDPAVPLRAWLHQALPDPPAALAQHNADLAADNLSVGNAVTSLRLIGEVDWTQLVARASQLMQVMLGSPLFEAEHTRTRDQTLHAIERIARRSRCSEIMVARALLGLMTTADADEQGNAAAHELGPAHWLNGEGWPALAQALGLPVGVAPAWRRARQRVVLPAYLGALLLGTLAAAAWLLRDGSGPVAWTGWTVLTVGLLALPASQAVVALINRLIGESVLPRRLPRLALAGGIPPAHRVMVVIPAMLSSPASTRALVHQLHLHHLANPEPCAQFALLTDWADADAPQAPGDEALLADAVAQIEALERICASPLAGTDVQAEAPRFILLHRTREFSATEQRWIGWERKRGKLERLVSQLATGAPGAFLDLGRTSRIAPGVRHLVTLDSDTRLPPGRLRELVGVAAHPHNLPRLEADGRRVRSGFAILQPHVAAPLPAAREVTPYHWLFAGPCGIDPYSSATSELYQDLFDEGSFAGKGLLNVQAVHALLGGRLPEDRVLSHDLLEGALARCAALSDLAVVEVPPSHADVAASRRHRWMRGDWQLLPFLLQPRRWPLGAVNRWKMLDNLRRSLVPPAALAGLCLALAGSGVSPWRTLLLVLLAFGAGPVMGALAGSTPSRRKVARRHFYRQVVTDWLRALGVALWQFAMLLQDALGTADAIVRALYRLGISRRHLLQWTTAEAAQAATATAAAASLRGTLRRHASEPMAAAVLLAAAWALDTPYPGLSLALGLLWGCAPLWTWWGSRPTASLMGPMAWLRIGLADDTQPPSVAERRMLAALARDTWRFFERCVSAQDHHLPPDNLQTAPHPILAHRTSPTNIGLYLLSAACARRFGWIDTTDLLTRLEATLGTLRQMQRHRGHFLNWYDTRTLAPLLPMYVSTVDSGNLSGHLLAVAQACREWALATERPAESARLLALAEAFEPLAWEADFSFLYDRRRHLLHIGHRVADGLPDPACYDLLASESRLASLLAIAKGDVPLRHWTALGRPACAVGSTAGLRSWSGSMFEYFMPGLVLDEPEGSVLHEACRAALQEQVAWAQAHGLPWGVSESAYAANDHTLAYQYAPQGVPRLALRRTPPDEWVVAPYATVLAAGLAPHRACQNLATLETLGARSTYGFIEALDFTPARQIAGGGHTPVQTFMAHHQGMTIVALANLLLDGAARRWGMGNAYLQAVAPLLHERAPREVPVITAPPPIPPVPVRAGPSASLVREVRPDAEVVPPTQLLSNGRYSVTLRPNGAGWSRWGTVGLTRSRDDALRDALGSFLYLRHQRHAPVVSLTSHPAPDDAARYQCTFHADRVCFDADWPHLQARTTVWVSPEDDVELRRVELHNLGDRPIEIELISAFEVSLSPPLADEAHPAFANLFVSSRWQAAQQALLFERTPRLPSEPALKMAHFLAETDPQLLELQIQTDRQLWAGRNRAVDRPAAQLVAPPLHGATMPDGPCEAARGVEPGVALATGLDPVCALSVRLRLPPSGLARLTFATAASDQAGTLQAVIDKYRQSSQVERASLMSTTLAGVRLRALQTRAEDFAAIQRLTTALVSGLTRVRHEAACLPPEHTGGCDRRLLWAHGISGDRPILLVTVGTPQGLGLLRVLAQALRLWSWGGIACDVVVLNMEPVSYEMALAHALAALQQRSLSDDNLPGWPATSSLQVLRADEVGNEVLSTLRHLARLQLHADGRPQHHHVQAWADQHEQAGALRLREAGCTVPSPTLNAEADPDPLPATPARAPVGRFLPERGGYQFDVSATQRPVRPWINVLSNPGFGTQVSETGAGCTWAVNSRLHQLTAWSNDPVADPPREWFLLQDTRTLAVWHVAPSAWGDPLATYQVTHDAGSTVIRHRRDALEVTTTWCVDPQTRVKQVSLRLLNHGRRSLALRLVGLVEWQMGASPADRLTVHTALHRELLTDGASSGKRLTALLATQQDHSAGFGGRTAFLALADAADPPGAMPDWSCDRRECFDARGRLTLPDHFGQRAGGGLDPCAALSTSLTLAPGGHAERVFLIGHADDAPAARRLAAEAAAQPAGQRLARSRTHWDELLGAVTVATPDPLLDVLVNRWLLYQTVSCRLWAKAGFYQAGGATGFRDQLQDAMALAWAAPAMLREQILRCAARQFAPGDVQHWWHAPTGAGVRTHFSDDLLWLPLACAHYLRATGDAALLEQRVPFLVGAAIPAGAEDVYDTPTASQEEATVFEHAARSIDRSLAVGAHGLPLMGSGDWNDGMNRVGSGGQGESVWLGWFLCAVVAGFAPLARTRGEAERADRWEAAAAGWRQALNTTAWDGGWFTRAYFDDGQPLGSQRNAQARIDLIAQAWSVLSHAGEPDLQMAAMAAVRQWLIDDRAGLIRLLDPPLTDAQPSAGYIQAYPPGVRENGGQYSHAGVWALMALAELARGGSAAACDAAGDEVYRAFTLLSPAHRSEHPVWGAAYGLEPYVMAGDVCSQPPYVGRGGWSWYTGAAAWLHRAAIESLFGLQLEAQQLSLRPCLPSHWPRAELTLTREGRRLHFIVLRANAATALAATAVQGARLLLSGQGVAWTHLGRHACFVLPLLDTAAGESA
jgi:cyclic beta-1,2-glucan synthetase